MQWSSAGILSPPPRRGPLWCSAIHRQVPRAPLCATPPWRLITKTALAGRERREEGGISPSSLSSSSSPACAQCFLTHHPSLISSQSHTVNQLVTHTCTDTHMYSIYTHGHTQKSHSHLHTMHLSLWNHIPRMVWVTLSSCQQPPVLPLLKALLCRNHCNVCKWECNQG